MSYIRALFELGPGALPEAGGKGANLGVLIAAGFPVPPGFCVVTEAYRAFVAANRLEPEIRRLSGLARAADPASLEAASAQIRALFAAGKIPPELANEICTAYGELSQGAPLAVAVRSSATAEDLPEMSFAGQQDTYLNVVGETALLRAVVQCWGSLWTARAMGYRWRNAVAQDEVALAVVVQQMVPSEASGVLFTANPLTGKRTETVIDATVGLGEALVSGQVEPDHYVVDTASGRCLSATLGAKAISVRGQAGGGTVTVAETAALCPALPEAQIAALAALGQRIARVFGAPQDIEWAWAAGRLAVVQSRPITSLFPLPAVLPTDGSLRVWLSFGVWQGMLDPFTPLGQDVLAGLVAGIGRRLGAALTLASQRVVVTAAERLYVDITPILRSPFGRRAIPVITAALDPASAGTLEKLAQDPRLAPQASRRPRLSTLGRLVPLFAPFAFSVLFNLINPAAGRKRVHRFVETRLASISRDFAGATVLARWTTLFETALNTLPFAWLPILVPAVVSGQAAFQTLLRLAAANLPGGEKLALELTRGLPHNVTTEMDLGLWTTAATIRADAAALECLTHGEAAALALDCQSEKLPPVAQTAVRLFLEKYGARGVGEIDIGRVRWREDPTPIIQVLKSYLQFSSADASPEVMFQRGAARAEAAAAQLIEALRQTPHGGLKARLARWQISRTRALAGLRETPKFSIIRLLGVFRQSLLACGRALAAEGRLAQADDVFFLHLEELKALGAGRGDWRALIVERRQTYARELRRRQLPRLLLSDGTAFFEGMQAPVTGDANLLVGSPVSAGVAEGLARVILDPRRAQLAPGEILVCPATDPAWTPLFLAAGGLVMEVGGMMTHGSVVAREYGIPAVVGVNQATTRLKTGQRIRVDGSTGGVVILAEAADIADRESDPQGS